MVTVREIDERAFTAAFFSLMGEVLCGDRFDPGNSDHRRWLADRISHYYLRGARFFARFLDGDAPIGFTGVEVDPKLEGVPYVGQYSEIVAIGVLGQHRRAGHGSELLKHSEGFARDQGAHCLYVATYAGAHDTIEFYGRSGYVPVATLPDVYGPVGEGRVYMRKVLAR